MGSIAGYWSRKANTTTDLTLRMLKAAPHRGTNYGQIKCSDGIELGVASAGSLPNSSFGSFDESAETMIVLDGAIFAFPDFENTKFPSDPELLIHSYLQYQDEFLSKIDGSFSLALYDSKKSRLILARDRLGTKPLFFASTGDAFVFGSEIKMILESRFLEKRVSLNSIDSFLSYSYVPAPLTMLEAIQQVKPGHFLVVDHAGVSERAYWRFRYDPIRRQESLDNLAEEFLDIFKKAVHRRLFRFPEACSFLSGGLDSSSVAAMMQHIKGPSFKVFTAGFKEKAYNEIEDARVVANHLGLDLLDTVIDFEDGFPSLLEKIVWHHDSPLADTSAIPSYYASKLAKEHADTVLTGDFPDQLIGGSGHQVRALSREKNDPVLLKGLRELRLEKVMQGIRWKAGGTGFLDKVKRFMYRETFPLEKQRILESMPVPPLLKRCLYSRDLMEINAAADPLELSNALFKEVEGESLLDKILYYDILSYAPDDLMIKVERMTTAHGLNAFSPFHDADFVSFIASLPPEMKIRGNERKFIMRQAMRAFLPEHTLNKKKQGFAMPIGEWLVRNLSGYVRDILLDSRTLNRGYFKKDFMRQMTESFLAGKSDYASGSELTIVCLLTLELWHRLFLDK